MSIILVKEMRNFDPVVWYEGELGKSVDENPLKAIEKCLNQIYQQQL